MSSPPEREAFFDADQKIWNGRKKSPFFHKDVSIGKVALFVLELNPQKVIQICDTTGERLTCQNLAQLGVRLAQSFKLKLGLQQEDVIGIMASNSTYIAPIALGAFLIGAPINAIHHALDKNTVKHIFGLTKPKVVFCDQEAYDTLVQGLAEIGRSCKIYTLKDYIDGVPNVKELLQEIGTDDDFSPEVLKNGGDQTAAILCSSGTTGLPKGVCVSHRNLLSRHDFSFMVRDDVLFTFSTLYWISGLWFLVHSMITGAQRVITDQSFSPELFFELIEKYKITVILGPPSHTTLSIQCPDIARRDLSSIRHYICGGSSVAVTVVNKMKEYLGKQNVSEAYGLSELGGMSNLNKWPHQKEGSVGRLSPNTRARIISDNGEPLGVGETGEIHIYSPYKWNGYYGNPETTRLTVDDEGWIKTGDLGYFDDDGFLFVSGRKKDILKYKNFQISPIEIEELIMEIAGVVEVCVFGIPDQVACDLPAAAIVKSPGCTLTEEDVRRKVASCLSEAKHLHGGVYFVSKLPKTPSGKVQRQKILPILAEIIKID